MKLYRSTETLPIAIFEKIINTKNLNYLNKEIDFDEVQDVEPTSEMVDVFNSIWNEVPDLDLKELYLEANIAYLDLIFEFETDHVKKWSAKNDSEVLKLDLEEIRAEKKESDNGLDFSALYREIGKMYNSVINPMTYSTKQFFKDKKALYERIERDKSELESRNRNKFDV